MKPLNFNTQAPDEEALLASVEGISHPHDFYEVAYANEQSPDIARLFSLSVFPAIRTLYRSKKYTIIRLYLGGVETTDVQHEALNYAYAKSAILDYHRAWLEEGEIRDQS